MTKDPVKNVKDTPPADLRSFKDRFEDLNNNDKKDLIGKLCALTGRSQRTIYRWMEGESTPTLLEQKTIAKKFGVSINQIF